MIIKSKTLAVLVVSILVAGILISSGLGWWKTESSKVAATFTEGEFAGQANPADIRGSYTFGDVEKNFGVSAKILAQAFNVSSDPSAFQVKGLEGTVTESGEEIGTASVRLFVAFYKNLPFDLSTDIYLTDTAAELLKQQKLTPEQLAYLETHTAKLAAPATGSVPDVEATAAVVSTPVPEATAPAVVTPAPAAATDRVIKGKTTFSEILGWSVLQASIEQVLGMPLPADKATTVKDFCTANNLNFETIKPALQAEVDKLK
ncbi:MAG: hypothetical protein WCK35_17245 [Chloroflexota bacterium]